MGFVRIIAGSLRGRRIQVPDLPGLRPTADRVREALFSILGSRVDGASVLDAYSGTGALGFEALSRGARQTTFLEADLDAARRIERTAVTFGLESRTTVIAGPVLSALSRRVGKAAEFDLMLADPPYGGSEAAEFLRRATAHLGQGGLLVLEREFRDDPSGSGPFELERRRTVQYGRACLDFFSRRDQQVQRSENDSRD